MTLWKVLVEPAYSLWRPQNACRLRFDECQRYLLHAISHQERRVTGGVKASYATCKNAIFLGTARLHVHFAKATLTFYVLYYDKANTLIANMNSRDRYKSET